jgi:hypothetical protein
MSTSRWVRALLSVAAFSVVCGCSGAEMSAADTGPAMDAASSDGGDAARADTGPAHDAGLDAAMRDGAVEDAARGDAAMDDAGSSPDAFVPLDAFELPDAFEPADAFVLPDAFEPPDAFVAPDAFVDLCIGVVCTASDACHAVGVCDPSTGACSDPAVPNGDPCDDGDMCTSSDSCQAGACTGGASVMCSALDACHVAGTCASASGCSNPAASDGTTCPFTSGAGGCRMGACVSQCADATRDGTETDLDCGGATCARCAVGRMCMVNSDCASTACNVVTLTCASSQCGDGRRDGAETDIDCGGGTCPSCAIAKMCTINADCSSNACDAITSLCISNQCGDHRRDGAETALDCGGGTCPACALGLGCAGDSDCTSNACDALTLICVSNQCVDHRRDGSESDVDCGGAVCPSCLVGQRCGANSDCQAGHVCGAAAPRTCL